MAIVCQNYEQAPFSETSVTCHRVVVYWRVRMVAEGSGQTPNIEKGYNGHAAKREGYVEAKHVPCATARRRQSGKIMVAKGNGGEKE